MQYNFHNEKYKAADLGGIHAEQFREYSDDTKYKNYVDATRTNQNLYLDLSEGGKNWFSRVKEAREHMEDLTGKSLRKDAVVLCSTVESVPTSWDPEVCKAYFKDKSDWYGHYLHEKAGVDEGAMLSLCVHLDEMTPHATYAWMPIKAEKFQAKNITTKTFLKALQTDSQDFTMCWIDGYNAQHPDNVIEKLEPAGESKRRHLSEIDYKVEKAKNRLEELEQKEVVLSDKVIATEEKIQIAERRYEEVVKDITKAPDLETYENVLQENENLREEISLKDRMIERLQESVEHWKNQAEEWKEKFVDAIHVATTKIRGLLGFDQEISENYSQSIEDLSNEIVAAYKDINPQGYADGEKVYPGYNYDQTYKRLKSGDSKLVLDNLVDSESVIKHRNDDCDLERHMSLKK